MVATFRLGDLMALNHLKLSERHSISSDIRLFISALNYSCNFSAKVLHLSMTLYRRS
jgi:hypothetical protein